jgi:hypothetical protein
MVTAALDAAARGWRVFPLAPGRKVPRRQLEAWETKATTDPDRIERWWARNPHDNIGIACGPSGLVVVDLDTAKPGDTPPSWARTGGGAAVLAQLVNEREMDLEPTWTVDTPSGGRHLYYRAPDWVELRNTAGKIGWRIDTRAAGGFVVAAGSRSGGGRYDVADRSDPAEMPEWMAALAAPPTQRVRVRFARPVTRARGYVATALTAELQRVLDAPSGTRNNTLYSAAWALGRFVAQGVIDRHVIEDALQHAGEATGLGAREVAATVRSALDARLRRGPAA